MNLSLIVAMDNSGLIGRDGALPWRLSSDLKRFRTVTMGKPIVMGRKTHDSIGRPLPGRENVIITRNRNYRAAGCTVLHGMDSVYSRFHDQPEIMIMGGSELYRQTLARAWRIYLTEVHAECEGDTCFPEFDRSAWCEVEREDHSSDEKNEFDYSFVILERRPS